MSRRPYCLLERLEFTTLWAKETDFSQELANDPTLLKHLGDTLGFELVLEATELAVGSYRADIVCKDLKSQDRVIIENQRGWTDHDHLGKLVVYASNTTARYGIWISDAITEEHLNAINWVNARTDLTFNAFAIELELLEIKGRSDLPVILKFNIRAQPNNWAKTANKEINLTFYENFWQAFRNRLLEKHPTTIFLKEPKLTAKHYYYMSYSLGVSGATLHVALTPAEQAIRITLELSTDKAKPHFDNLCIQKDVIEQAVGEHLSWDRGEGRVGAEIFLLKNSFDFATEAGIEMALSWSTDKLIRMHGVMSEYLKA